MQINEKFTKALRRLMAPTGGALLALGTAPVALAQMPSQPAANGAAQPLQATPDRLAASATYADLVTLAQSGDLVLRAQIRRQTALKPERAPGLAPGFARLYIEADTLALIAGNTSVGESLVYLVDVPLGADGKPPKLKKREMLLFARPGGRGPKGALQLQLAGKYAQLAYSPELEARLRPVLGALVAADVPPVVTGVRDALAVPGTLVGETETQIFLESEDGSPVSITVLRRPGQPVAWGVSWGEIIDSAASSPAPRTLRWYRLACALPPSLPSSANLARDPEARALAERDYAHVIKALGPCERVLTAS
jgi:hypothetical protein